MLLGHLVDRWLDTHPLVLLIGFGLGVYAGFVKLWNMSKRAEEESRAR
jgi:F0F1-type ATP synthase assembly protein I